MGGWIMTSVSGEMFQPSCLLLNVSPGGRSSLLVGMGSAIVSG